MIIWKIRKELEVKSLSNHKQLERDKGFLIYISRTYRIMSPYLKGVHLTLDSWRRGRNKDGWKKSRRELLKMMCDDGGENEFLGESGDLEDMATGP